MKQLLITIAAALLVGCGESQQSTPAPESKPEPSTAKAPNISIHDAAWKGNIEVGMQHIAAGTDLNVKNVHRLGQHRTPLYYAAKRGHKDIVMLLIAADADVNVKFENGKTTLDWLSSSGEMADLLRKHGGKRGNELKVHRK